MPLNPPQPVPKTQADWDRWARSTPINPDDGSTGTGALIDDSVTNEKLDNMEACSIKGRAANAAGDPGNIQASSNDKFLVRRANVLTFDALADGDIPTAIARDTEVAAAIAAHEAAADPHTGYQKESEKDAASGYAGLNSASRITKGAITTDDLVINLATKGLVLKDTQGTPHYWRITISNVGALVITDLGTTVP
jgi:hypothetical protein